MKSAVAYKDREALSGLIRVFERLIVQALISSPTVAFEPLMVVDLRSGMFQAFVLSLRVDGTFYAVPRQIEIEEASQFSVMRSRVQMCAYRKKKTQSWVICSESRLKEKASEPDFETVDHVIEYMLTLAESERSTLERLWHAFLARLTTTDSGQDYSRVIFVVDNADVVPLLERIIPSVGERIDRTKGNQKWQSGTVIHIDPAFDLTGFVFLNAPRDFQNSQARYLLLRDQNTAIEAAFDGFGFQYTTVHSVELKRYNKIVVVGLTDVSSPNQDLLRMVDERDFEVACLNGYLYGCLQIDDRRVEELRQKFRVLEQQLAAKKSETQKLTQLLSRLKNVLYRVT